MGCCVRCGFFSYGDWAAARSDTLNVGTSIHIDYRNLCRGSTLNDFVSPESGKPQHSGANTSTLPLISICHCHHAVINCSANWFVLQNAMLADLGSHIPLWLQWSFFSFMSRGDTLNVHPCGQRVESYTATCLYVTENWLGKLCGRGFPQTSRSSEVRTFW